MLHWCINSVRKGGNVSIVGVYGPTFNAVPIGNALNKGLTLRMNQGGRAELEHNPGAAARKAFAAVALLGIGHLIWKRSRPRA